MRSRLVAAAWLAVVGSAGCSATPDGVSVPLPDAGPGIGFDDLRYSSSLERVLVPAGRSGYVDLVDPDTLSVTPIGGFTELPDYSGGHDDGPTSVDEGHGLLFVTDRSTSLLSAVDPLKRTIVASTPLASRPDYVRYVETTDELWVTEPDDGRIQVVKLDATAMPPKMTSVAFIGVRGGPESLAIDGVRGFAYTNLRHGETVVVDLKARRAVATWDNGCDSSRGLALDAPRGYLFVACDEGKVSVFDVPDGAFRSDIAEGAGVDVIGYSPERSHLYVAGGASDSLGIVGVSSAGGLSLLGSFDTVDDASCATADDHGHAWICAPNQGGLLRIDDTFPPSR